MTRGAANNASPPHWLAEWIQNGHRQRCTHSLPLTTSLGTELAELACAVAEYLNEFAADHDNHWRAFDADLLKQLAADPACRNLVLSDANADRGRSIVLDQSQSDLERIAQRLVRLGGVILESSEPLGNAADDPQTFHICLSTDEPAQSQSCRFHIRVNPDRFSLRALVCVIADSFLNWTSHPRSTRESIPVWRNVANGHDRAL